MTLITLTIVSLLTGAQLVGSETVLNAPEFRLTQPQVERFLREGYGEGVATVHVYPSARDMVRGGLGYLTSVPQPYRRAVNFSLIRQDKVYAASCDLLIDDGQDSLQTANCQVSRGDIQPFRASLSHFTQVKP